MTSDLGPPEVLLAQLEMAVDGMELRPLMELTLEAVMGVARLYVPRSLQVKGSVRVQGTLSSPATGVAKFRGSVRCIYVCYRIRVGIFVPPPPPLLPSLEIGTVTI